MSATIRRTNEYAVRQDLRGLQEFGHPRLLAPRYDNLFKLIVTSGWCVKSDGDVESSAGYFSLTEIPSHPGELKEMYEAISSGVLTTEFSLDRWPDAGWYVTTELNTGLIFVFEHKSKEAAESGYAEALEEYERWLNGEAY